MRPLVVLRHVLLLALAVLPLTSRGEAMLQLFNVNWDELIVKMPEIAEAGYTSLWLPPPAKAGSVYSVGYDQFDPFDLGDKNQRGTVRTRYGTKDQLLQVVELAHRFGLRVYFDNIMNHRGFDIPGYNASTPTNLYPGLVPGDFHLKTVGSYFQNWPNVSNWSYVDEVQRQPLFGLIDLANEPGSLNLNFGNALFNSVTKPSLIRQPGNPDYYMDSTKPAIAGPWRPFNGTNGVPVAEDVNSYLIRAAMWMLNETKCDGFRFDAVKHVPSGFFGATSGTPDGYTGAIQTMFDYVHGYGNNATGNGYLETDDNRNSCFDVEAVRNDAMLFGEHLGQPPSYYEYLTRGMRLLNSPYHFYLNNILGNPSAGLGGLEQRDFRPNSDPSNFTGAESVLFAQSHDDGTATHRELQEAYNFVREGLPAIYSDGYNQSGPPDYFPKIAYAPYLGEFGDNTMPELASLHHQLARGGTRPRWGDADIVAFERYDYRDVNAATAYTNPDATVVLFAMNDNYASDIAFVDGEGDIFPSASVPPGALGDKQGLVVGFPPGSVLVQLASSAPGYASTFKPVTVRPATNDRTTAHNSGGSIVYVGGQTLAPGGGAIEILVPSGGYVTYGYQWPEPSRVSYKDAITFRQGGVEVPHITVYRKDGVNGDPGFNPVYPFKMRGSVDASGVVVGGANVSNLTYAIDVPILTNGPVDIVVRSDASTVNTLLKLDGGLDLNSQMVLGPTNGFDRRDNRPGYVSDVFLGYEQALWHYRYGPEKFAARDVSRVNVTSLGAETYYYTAVVTNGPIINGSGNGTTINTSTATNVLHDPSALTTVSGQPAVTQRNPLSVGASQSADIWVKVWVKFRINKCYLYYTTDGTNPEGSFGTGLGTTRVIEGGWIAADASDSNIDWWKVTIPTQLAGTQVRYKVALFHNNVIPPIGDNDNAKLYGLNQAVITNFNPATATVWLHNDLNTSNTTTGLREGFHIVRARCFLPRDGKSGVFNTFVQTFYYDAQVPTGVIAYPPADGASISNGTYQVVVRTDSSVTGLDFNIQDSDPTNDDATTGANNGNGLTNGVAKFVSVAPTAPNSSLDAQYPNLPQEFRFNYVLVPSSGTATITVRLREASSSLFTNRLTTLTRTVNTSSPPSGLTIANPPVDGTILTVASNATVLTLTCFTTGLTNDVNLYSIYVNGVLQARSNYIFIASGCAAGLRSLYYYWTPTQVGTNTIQVTYSNFFALADTRVVAVARPGDTDGDGVSDYNEIISGTDPLNPNSVLRITELANGNTLVVWDSVPGINYQVQATTDLAQPMTSISPVIQASAFSSFFSDPAPAPTNKFYRIKVVP